MATLHYEALKKTFYEGEYELTPKEEEAWTEAPDKNAFLKTLVLEVAEENDFLSETEWDRWNGWIEEG